MSGACSRAAHAKLARAAAGLLLVVATAPARAERGLCADRVLTAGPIFITLTDAQAGAGRDACHRSEVGGGVAARAIIDTEAFYGAIVASGLVFASGELTASTELFGGLEVLRYDYAQNASLSGGRVSIGQLGVGLSQALHRGPRLALSAVARLQLPTSTATPRVRVVGAELGVSAALALTRRLSLHGYAGTDGSLGLSSGPTLPEGAIGGALGGEVQLLPWLALAIDLRGRAGATRALIPAAALRASPGGLGLELAATVPVVGTDRHDGALGLRASGAL